MSFRRWLVVAALAPMAAHATSYKCVVDGKTAYQGQPCSEGQGYVQARTELLKAAAIDRDGVTFITAEAAGYASKGPHMVRIHFDWVDTKPCITHVDSVLKAEPR